MIHFSSEITVLQSLAVELESFIKKLSKFSIKRRSHNCANNLQRWKSQKHLETNHFETILQQDL